MRKYPAVPRQQPRIQRVRVPCGLVLRVMRVGLEMLRGRGRGGGCGEREWMVWVRVRRRRRQRLVYVLQTFGQLSGGGGGCCGGGGGHGRRRRGRGRPVTGGGQSGRLEHGGAGRLFVRGRWRRLHVMMVLLVVMLARRMMMVVLVVVNVMLRRLRRRLRQWRWRRNAARIERRTGRRAARFALRVVRDRRALAASRRTRARAHDRLDGETDFWLDDHRRRGHLYHFKTEKTARTERVSRRTVLSQC